MFSRSEPLDLGFCTGGATANPVLNILRTYRQMLGQFFSIFAFNIYSILTAGRVKDWIINCSMCFSGVLLYGQPFQWCKQTILLCYLLFLKSLCKSLNLLNNFWLSSNRVLLGDRKYNRNTVNTVLWERNKRKGAWSGLIPI